MNRNFSNMKTINSRPIKTVVILDFVLISWKCHGINQFGNRVHWAETTSTPLHPCKKTLAEFVAEHEEPRGIQFDMEIRN